MIEKLNIVKQRFDEVNDLIIQPDVIADQKRYIELNKEYKDLRALMDEREKYLELTNNIEEAKEIIAFKKFKIKIERVIDIPRIYLRMQRRRMINSTLICMLIR